MKKFIIIVMILAFLTSCTADFKVNEEVVKDLSDKITATVINTLDKEKVEKTENHTIDISNISELKIDSSVGDINIIVENVKDASIDVNIVAYSEKKEEANKLIEEYTYKVESKGNSINIDTTQFKNKIQDINVSINLDIKIPNSITDISIANNVGAINIDNMEGRAIIKSDVGDISIKKSKAYYDIKNNVGTINLNNCTFIDKSEININTGDIEVSAADIYEAKSIEVTTMIGNISISLPKDSSYKATIDEFMEKERTVAKSDGKTKIMITTKVGDVKFQ